MPKKISENLGFRFSYSSLTEYTQCSKRYQLKRIQKAPEVPAWWLVLGTTVHALTEEFDKIGVLANYESIVDAVDSAVRFTEDTSGVDSTRWQKTYYDRNRSYVEMQDLTAKKVDDAYNAYVSWRMNSDLELLAVEKEVSWESDGLAFVGYVDRLFRLADGRVGVVDIKTGKSIPKSTQQLGFYRAALSSEAERAGQHGELLHCAPSVGAYWLASTGELTTWTDLRAWTQARVSGLGSQLERGVRQSMFLPNVGDGCRTCPVRQSCYAFSGDTELSRQFDPDNPKYEDVSQSS